MLGVILFYEIAKNPTKLQNTHRRVSGAFSLAPGEICFLTLLVVEFILLH